MTSPPAWEGGWRGKGTGLGERSPSLGSLAEPRPLWSQGHAQGHLDSAQWHSSSKHPFLFVNSKGVPLLSLRTTPGDQVCFAILPSCQGQASLGATTPAPVLCPKPVEPALVPSWECQGWVTLAVLCVMGGVGSTESR